MKKGFFITKTSIDIVHYIAIITLLAVVAISGCRKKLSDSDSGDSREIRIAASIEQLGRNTKAAVGSTSTITGAKFVIMNSTSKPSAVATGVTYTGNRSSQVSGAITWTAADGTAATDADIPLYSLNRNTSAYIKGLWPGSGSGVAISETEFVWQVDGKTDIIATDIWDAGSFQTPITGVGENETSMAFHHALAQLEVICMATGDAAVIESDVQNLWGKITKIELLSSKPQLTYTLATNVMTPSGMSRPQSLVGVNYIDDFPAAGITLTKSNTEVNAAGMFTPAAVGSVDRITIRIYSEKLSGGYTINVQIKDDQTNKGFEAGKKHIITLMFSDSRQNIEVFSTSIEPWGTGGRSDQTIDKGGVASVGKYHYADGSLSTKLLSDKTPIGIVFWVDPEGSSYKIASIDEPSASWNGGTNEVGKLQWSTENFTTNANDAENGTTNMNMIKIIDDWQTKYPAFAWCDAKNRDGQSGWYLPVKRELQYLYSAYNDNIPITWDNNQNAPFYDSKDEVVRLSWNSLFEAAAGGIGFASSPYLSSEEVSPAKCTYVHYAAGSTSADADKTDATTHVRCVREYKTELSLQDRPKIGDIRNGGVVYWVDHIDPTRYNIMSSGALTLAWSAKKHLYILGPGDGQDQHNGLKNMDAMLRYMKEHKDEITGKFATDFPASAYCYYEYLPEGSWYLPSSGEAYLLVKQYQKHKYAIEKALENWGNLSFKVVLSSTEYAGDPKLVSVIVDGNLTFKSKEDSYFGRCISRYPLPPSIPSIPISNR